MAISGLRASSCIASTRNPLALSLTTMSSAAAISFRRELRYLRDAETRARSLSYDVDGLRYSLKMSKAGKEKLKARVATLRAAGATSSKLAFDEAAQLRTVLRRSRRQKTAIRRLRKENARLRKAVEGSRCRIETLETQLAKLRASGSVMSKRLYGSKSEQQKKPGTGHNRGQQRGAHGHGRTQRPGLEERPEEIVPPPEECACARCGQPYAPNGAEESTGQPYAPNGAEESTVVEIEVKAHKRVISRPRFRRTCECASSPMEVLAPPVPRLFANTLYGISVWACFLFERYACFRTLNGVAAWMSDRGLAISPGTLANSRKRFVPLFEPLYEAILAHQNTAALRHADETSWRVQELRREDRSSRAWLWASVSSDAVCFHIDPSRSAEAALKLFAKRSSCSPKLVPARSSSAIATERISASFAFSETSRFWLTAGAINVAITSRPPPARNSSRNGARDGSGGSQKSSD